LIEAHKDQWDVLAQEYEQLRGEAVAGRTSLVAGLSREATTFYDYVIELAYDGGEIPAASREPLKELIARIVIMLTDTIDVLDFWHKPIEVKRLRGNLDTEILLADIPQLNARHERIAVEIVKLAQVRHKALVE